VLSYPDSCSNRSSRLPFRSLRGHGKRQDIFSATTAENRFFSNGWLLARKEAIFGSGWQIVVY